MKICKVKNCNNQYSCKGYCQNHYHQFKKYGKIFERTRFTPNEIIDKGDYCEMVLYGKEPECKEVARTLFSKKHLDKVKKYKWSLHDNKYCIGIYKNSNLKLHHFIKGKPPKGLVTDHINHNKLDNRDENLRFVTNQQNTSHRNPNLPVNSISGIRGVHWNEENKAWEVSKCINGKNKYYGSFKNKEDAIKVANKIFNPQGVRDYV